MPLHPQARSFLDLVAKKNAPPWESLAPSVSRSMFNGLTEFFGQGPELNDISDKVIADKVPVRIYRPDSKPCLPAIMYFHGGGWVLGNIETHDAMCRHLAKDSGSMVISVNYRLAPEHPFPAAFDDCYEATRYVSHHAAELGVDPTHIAVAGDSAGGNLAAAVTLKAREEGTPNIHSQWLIYPVLEANFDTVSYKEFAIDHGLTRRTMQFFWDQYSKKKTDRSTAYAAPLKADHLRDLPFTQIITAEYDVLRDEGEQFARLLKKAGVEVELIQYDGMLHGFMHFAAAFDEGKRALAELGKAMNTRFGLGCKNHLNHT